MCQLLTQAHVFWKLSQAWGVSGLVKQDKLKELDSKIKVLIGKNIVDF